MSKLGNWYKTKKALRTFNRLPDELRTAFTMFAYQEEQLKQAGRYEEFRRLIESGQHVKAEKLRCEVCNVDDEERDVCLRLAEQFENYCQSNGDIRYAHSARKLLLDTDAKQ